MTHPSRDAASSAALLVLSLLVAIVLPVSVPVPGADADPAPSPGPAPGGWESDGGTFLLAAWDGPGRLARAETWRDDRVPAWSTSADDPGRWVPLEPLDWSPDRRRVLVVDPEAGSPGEVRVVDTVSGERTAVRVPDRSSRRSSDEVVWVGDDHVATLAEGPDGAELWRTEVATGTLRRVAALGAAARGITAAPGGAAVAALRHDAVAGEPGRWRTTVVRVHMTTGAVTELATVEGTGQDLAWSPDGGRLALSTADGLQVLELGGGPLGVPAVPRPVPGSSGDLAWSPTSEWLLVQAYAGPREVVHVDSGVVQPGPVLPGSYDVVDWQPDPVCTVVGTDGDDVLEGTAGDDVVCAGEGDDVIVATGGRDVVLGGPGRDRLDHRRATVPVAAHLDRWLVRGGQDPEASAEVHDVEELRGGPGDDLVLGSSADEVLLGGGGDDELDGGRGDDRLHGGAGRDGATFGHPWIEGLDEWWTVTADLRAGRAVGVAGADRLEGIEDLTAWDGGRLVGDDGRNRLATHRGGILSPGGGRDVVAGDGRVDYADAPRGITVDQDRGLVRGWGRDRLVAFHGNGPARGFGGSAHGDTFVLGRGGAMGRAGDDTVVVTDEALYAVGGSGRDTVDLSALPDGVEVAVRQPPDTFPGGAVDVTGVEEVVLTAHDDVSLGGPRVVRAGAGDDVLVTTPAAERVLAGPGDDLVAPSRGTDVLRGGGGDDVLGHVGFARLLHGGAGQDAVVLADARARVRVDLGRGTAQVMARWLRSRRAALRSVEDVVGTAYDDLLVGSRGPNVLLPGPGRDDVSGRGGSDTVLARDGERDRVDAGAGRDACSLDARDRAASCERGADDVLERRWGQRLLPALQRLRSRSASRSPRPPGW